MACLSKLVLHEDGVDAWHLTCKNFGVWDVVLPFDVHETLEASSVARALWDSGIAQWVENYGAVG